MNPLPVAQPGVTTRPATHADEDLLAAVLASTRPDLAGAGWPEDLRRTVLRQQHLAQQAGYRAAHPDGRFMVVEVEGVPVGRLYLADVPEGLLLIDIALLPDHRRRGLGTALLDAVEAEARGRGVAVVLHADRDGMAHRWYRRRGYLEGAGDAIRVALRLPPAAPA